MTRHIVFVCEHGAAKSVLAATYFNHLAERRGLAVQAVARGTAPDAAIPAAVLNGLSRDGLTPCTKTPTPLAQSDVEGAWRVVSFDQPQVAVLAPGQIVEWDDLPPVSSDFEAARQAIVAKVQVLLADLEAEGSP